MRPKSGAVASSTLLEGNNFNHVYFNDMDDLEFLFREAPESFMVRCQIVVHVNKLTTNDYDLWLEGHSRDSPLLSSQSKRAVTGVNMIINSNTLDVLLNKYRPKKLGKLKSDINRNFYDLVRVTDNESMLTQAQLHFRKQSLTSPTPKELEVFLHSTLMDGYSSEKRQKLATKSPEYDRVSKTYRLDFKGRAKKISYNNMQITCIGSGSDQPVWQLGKVRKNHYILDFSYPFNMFSAFGTALTCMTK